eukprot:403373687
MSTSNRRQTLRTSFNSTNVAFPSNRATSQIPNQTVTKFNDISKDSDLQFSQKRTPYDSIRSTKSNIPNKLQKQYLPIVKESNEKMIKEYYNSFMQGQFLYDESTNRASKRLKERLQKMHEQQSVMGKSSHSTRVSPNNRSSIVGGVERLSETRVIERGENYTRLMSNISREDQINLNQTQLSTTFYMIDQNGHNKQTKLGLIDTSTNSNLLEKHKFLLDPQNLKHFSVGVFKKRLLDLKQKTSIEKHQENYHRGSSSMKSSQKSLVFKDEIQEFLDEKKKLMNNPLKTGDITFTELRCIDKMKKMGRWKEPENLKRVDSLVESVYNSEKNMHWRNYKPESRDKLMNTEASEEEFDLFRKSDTENEDEEDGIIIDDPDFSNAQNYDNLQEELKLKKKQEELERKKQEYLNSAKNSPRILKKNFLNGLKSGALTPATLNHDKVEIGGIHIASIKEHGPLGILLKSKEYYCNEMQIAPVKFLNYYNDGILQLHNYNIQPNLCVAIACTIPYLIDLEGIKFKNNGIKDECASLILKAVSLCPKFRIFHFEKNEINQEFVDVLKEVMEEQQDLTYLDLSNNNLDAISCKHLGYLIRTTSNLQDINLSYCGIRGHSARMIVNSLLLNQTIKYINLCWNSFASSDYEFGSKLARIIQVHQNLIHVDLTCTQLKREETMYIAQCLKDSVQIVSCHLTGNHVDYYSRIFLRAHLNAIVQYPNKNNSVIQNVVLAHDRAQIIGLNQIIQSNFMVPGQANNQQNQTNNNQSGNYLTPQNQDQKYNYGPRGVSTNKQEIISTSFLEDSLRNFKYNLSSDTSQDSEIDEENNHLPNDLKKYLAGSQNRIYDMIQMLDIYGRKQKDHDMKMEYLQKYKQGNVGDVKNFNDALQIKGLDQEQTSNQSRKLKANASDATDFQRAMNVIFQAYDDKLLANPMQGFLKDLIFARYLGHTDIENGQYWRDCNQCWVCEKWDKVKVDFQFNDAIEDLKFQKIQDFLSAQQNGVIRDKDLNPIWEEHLESLDDEYEERQQDIEIQQRKVVERKNPNLFEQDVENAKHPPQSRKSNIMSLANLAKQFLENPLTQSQDKSIKSVNEPQTYDQTIVKITENGPVDLKVSDLQGKTLYNSSIFPIMMNIEKIQKLIIPTHGLSTSDNQVIIDQGCVPYRPFQKIQALQKEQHVIKLPNIYTSSDQLPLENISTANNTGAMNSRQQSKDRLQVAKVPTLKLIQNQNKPNKLLPIDPIISPLLTKKTPRIRTKNEILKINQDLMVNFQNIPETDDVYLVASFNHWFPVKMEISVKKMLLLKDEYSKREKLIKEQQSLLNADMPENIKKRHQRSKSRLQKKEAVKEVYKTIEKEEEHLYEKEKVKIENVFKYTNFLPSGKHYFYFIKKGKYYCLSDKFPVKRFKNTNLYMNEIIINKRDWAISDVQPRTKDSNDPYNRFDKSRSVFRNFRDDDEELLRKIFELDFSYSKIARIIKNNEEELQNVKELFWSNYIRLRNIYLTLILNSEYPIITWNDFTIFCNKCKVVDKNISLSIIDTIYIATNVSLNNNQNADRDLSRYEFLEILLRLANEKYKKSGQVTTYTQALQRFLDENLYPNIEETNSQIFRDTQLYTFYVNELLVRNEPGLRKIFGMFIHGQKRFINFKDAIELINTKAELRFLDRQVIKQFGLSKMSHVDALKDPSFPNRMSFTEFLEFLGRIAFEIFKDHEGMQNEPLHLKYDALLTKLFKIVRYQKCFTFLEYQKQNVVYEVILNPQLALTGGMDRQLSADKFDGERQSDGISIPSARMNNY